MAGFYTPTGGASSTYRSGIRLKRDRCFSEFLTPKGGSTPFLVQAQKNLGITPVGVTAANLPASPQLGQEAVVTDATAPAWGAAVVGGGALFALVTWNGTAWTVIGK